MIPAVIAVAVVRCTYSEGAGMTWSRRSSLFCGRRAAQDMFIGVDNNKSAEPCSAQIRGVSGVETGRRRAYPRPVTRVSPAPKRP